MQVLVIENWPKTTLGLVGRALDEAGAHCDIRRMHAGDQLPAAHDGHDALIMLGGTQTAVQDQDHPYLREEAALARAFALADKPVLGICLGAQILARGLGGENLIGHPLEFGWHPVTATLAGRSDPVLAALGDGAWLFHWHSDTFTLPVGAVHLALSAMTTNQAFRFGRFAYGIQFHFEAGTELVAAWNRDFADEIAAATPDWFDRHASEAARQGKAADAAGLAIARAWVAVAANSISSIRRTPARQCSEPLLGAAS